ncbi:hypothetical protein HPB48_014715 [Haemaphysalis longicornis]|uniref:Uncharacterized protein n=1 Tax=Haemaphysalis longicornis TaxID=44386 RepID=A0A9J6GSL9_HAELO|nr:hypothetical protein HPB48_014715 [Haemaphysalis longicornis]
MDATAAAAATAAGLTIRCSGARMFRCRCVGWLKFQPVFRTYDHNVLVVCWCSGDENQGDGKASTAACVLCPTVTAAIGRAEKPDPSSEFARRR